MSEGKGNEDALGRIAYLALIMAFKLVSRLPLSICAGAGTLLGRLGASLPVSRLRVALVNLERVYGDSMDPGRTRGLYREIFIHFGRMLFEIPRILRLNAGNLGDYAVFEGWGHLRDALKAGKGCFILTAHFGNWEILNAAVTVMLKGRAAIVARPLDFPPLEKIFSNIRSRFGAEIIPKRRAMRRILKCIKDGLAVGILLDQNVDWYEGVFVPFLGIPACSNKALALLALKTGAPVIPAFAVRMPDGRYRIVIERALEIIRTGDETFDVEENTRLFTETIERYVKVHPDQWFWFHRRWKTKPFCPVGHVTD